MHLGAQIAAELKGYNYGLLPNLGNLHKLNLPADTAILMVSINRPKISAVKAIGVGVLSAGLTGGYLVVSSYGIPSTFGYMVYPQTGDILWTNYGPNIRFSKSSQFFQAMPDKSSLKKL